MNIVHSSFAVFLITIWLSSPVVAQISIVSPNDRANAEGSTLNSIGQDQVGNPVRLLYLHHASDFAALPEGGLPLVSMQFRLDESWNSAGSVNQPNTEIRLSTTSVNSLSPTYAANIGEDELLVLSGDTTTIHPAPTATPRDFSNGFVFDQPFHYDPSKGNLLLDLTFNDGFSTDFALDAHSTPGVIATIGDIGTATAVDAALAGESVLVRRFHFVPEPSGGMLLAFGLAGMLGLRPQRQMAASLSWLSSQRDS